MLDVGSALPVLLVGVHFYISAQGAIDKLVRTGTDGVANVSLPANLFLVALVQHDHVVGGEEVFGGGEGGVHINGNMGIVHDLRVAVAGDVGIGDHGVLWNQIQRPRHIFGSHFVPVVEVYVIANGEVPFLTVLAVGPLGGDPGFQRIGGGVVPDQGVIQSENDQTVPVGHGHVVGHGNDIGNFGADTNIQNPVCIAICGVGNGGCGSLRCIWGGFLAAAAAQAANQQKDGQYKSQILFHKIASPFIF